MRPSDSLPTGILDVRCSARHERGERCQLYVGHEGEHAVLFARAGRRMIGVWREGSAPQENAAAQENRPWAPGLPLPAWEEPAPPRTRWEPRERDRDDNVVPLRAARSGRSA